MPNEPLQRTINSSVRLTLVAVWRHAYDPSVEPGLSARLVLRAKTGPQIDLHPIVIDELGND